MFRGRVVAFQLKAQLLSDDEELFAVVVGHGIPELQRPGGQLLRRARPAAEKRARFPDRPDVVSARAGALKEEILTVARKVAAALLRRLVPVLGQHATDAAAGCLHLPQLRSVVLLVIEGKAHSAAVG